MYSLGVPLVQSCFRLMNHPDHAVETILVESVAIKPL